MTVRKPVLVLAMKPDLPPRLFTAEQRKLLSELAITDPDLVLTEFGSADASSALAGAEVLLTGWGCPPIDDSVLASAPGLRAIIHAAGSVKGHVRPVCWERGLRVSSAADANARPVAEYTVAMVLLAGKETWRAVRMYRERQEFIDREAEFPDAGNYGQTVGVIGASRIGRRVLGLLRQFDLEVLLSDPFVDEADAASLGAQLVELDELMMASDIVTVHAPDLPTTRHLIDRRRLALLRDGATLINTARGALVDQDALRSELSSGRLHAIIDVTDPDVLPSGSPLYTLPNLILTPHIAGAMGRELHRLAASALDELARYTRDEPFRHPVDLAHLWRAA